MKDEFYIGYLPKASNSYKKKIRLFIGVLMIAIPALAYILVGNQNGFPTSTFELGKLTTLEGVLTTEPVPMLKILHGRDHQGGQYRVLTNRQQPQSQVIQQHDWPPVCHWRSVTMC